MGGAPCSIAANETTRLRLVARQSEATAGRIQAVAVPRSSEVSARWRMGTNASATSRRASDSRTAVPVGTTEKQSVVQGRDRRHCAEEEGDVRMKGDVPQLAHGRDVEGGGLKVQVELRTERGVKKIGFEAAGHRRVQFVKTR